MVKYGLRNKKTGELLSFETASNHGDFCVDVCFTLSEFGEVWLVDDYETARKVYNSSTKWYNADFNSPTYYLKMSEYEIVKVELTLSVVDTKLVNSMLERM